MSLRDMKRRAVSPRRMPREIEILELTKSVRDSVCMLLKRVLCIYFRRTIKADAEACGCVYSPHSLTTAITVCIVGARCASGWTGW